MKDKPSAGNHMVDVNPFESPRTPADATPRTKAAGLVTSLLSVSGVAVGATLGGFGSLALCNQWYVVFIAIPLGCIVGGLIGRALFLGLWSNSSVSATAPNGSSSADS